MGKEINLNLDWRFHLGDVTLYAYTVSGAPGMSGLKASVSFTQE